MEYVDKAIKPYLVHRAVVGIIFSSAIMIYLIKNKSEAVYSKDPKTGDKVLSKGYVALFAIIFVILGAFLDLIIVLALYGLAGGR
jgi:hypothetical protein